MHHDDGWIQHEAQRTLKRLLPRVEAQFTEQEDYAAFAKRLNAHFPRAFGHLLAIYGDKYDFFYHLQTIIETLVEAYLTRSADLHHLDRLREENPHWYKSEDMVGGVCYVDLFAGDLNGVRAKIPYFKELGLTYLHLMPFFKAPAENSDGGYAVSDYRQVMPDLGTMDDLATLAAALREVNISLVLDFVFNHTSDEHRWALGALEGDPEYQDYYYLFPDRTLPDQYEDNLREIFPEQAPGSFTYRDEISRWVWTTFNDFQWDLNYSNPAVFNAMLGEMLFLANQGTQVLRLDAVAFIWKRLGTPCENLPQVHDIIRAFNALVQIAAPAMIFKSEAIVHPDDVASYIDWHECPLSYNPTFMALVWEALATREVKLLRYAMSRRYEIEPRSAWVNYIRVHDDIGWSFADEDAAAVGIHNGFDHRQFLNAFYTGRFGGSFANGLGFNFNPHTLDMRICGTTASLAGLEQAIAAEKGDWQLAAQQRIAMMHSVILGAGGIPLIYLGDEIAMLNDYSYKEIPGKVDDGRWVHRPAFDWERAEDRHNRGTAPGFVFTALQRMINARKRTPALADLHTLFFDNGSPHVLSFIRNSQVLVLANFSENHQDLERSLVNYYWRVPAECVDLISGATVQIDDRLHLAPYQYLWLIDSAAIE